MSCSPSRHRSMKSVPLSAIGPPDNPTRTASDTSGDAGASDFHCEYLFDVTGVVRRGRRRPVNRRRLLQLIAGLHLLTSIGWRGTQPAVQPALFGSRLRCNVDCARHVVADPSIVTSFAHGAVLNSRGRNDADDRTIAMWATGARTTTLKHPCDRRRAARACPAWIGAIIRICQGGPASTNTSWGRTRCRVERGDGLG